MLKYDLHILRAEVNVGTAGRQRVVVVRELEEELRHAFKVIVVSMFSARRRLDSQLTMPPVADDPAAKRVQRGVKAR